LVQLISAEPGQFLAAVMSCDGVGVLERGSDRLKRAASLV
jgi:hypothetical protein